MVVRPIYSGTMLYDAVENAVGNPVVSWKVPEAELRSIDVVLFRQKLNITADLFYEHRYDILSTRNTLPAITNISLPMLNLGESITMDLNLP